MSSTEKHSRFSFNCSGILLFIAVTCYGVAVGSPIYATQPLEETQFLDDSSQLYPTDTSVQTVGDYDLDDYIRMIGTDEQNKDDDDEFLRLLPELDDDHDRDTGILKEGNPKMYRPNEELSLANNRSKYNKYRLYRQRQDELMNMFHNVERKAKFEKQRYSRFLTPKRSSVSRFTSQNAKLQQYRIWQKKQNMLRNWFFSKRQQSFQ